jgi:hypothetical protein
MVDSPNASRRETALEHLRATQTAIESEQVADALKHAQRLQAEWARAAQILAARAWLDESLAGELLAFNSERARQQLEAWRGALDEDASAAEVDAYAARVQDYTRRKQEMIHVRGVVSHCDELLQKADELEKSSNPPNPQFVIENYYAKVDSIAAAARDEIAGSPELDVLQRKAEQTHNRKRTAARIYPAALEDDKYTDALTQLDALPASMLIPRFVAISDSGERRTTFSNMVSQTEARIEIRERAQAWVEREAAFVIQAAQEALDAHDPETAVANLEESEHLHALLASDTLMRLNDIRQRATTTLRSKQKAAELLQQAAALAPENDIAAWEMLTQAQMLYEWLDKLSATHEIIVSAMRKKLSRMVKQADAAFQERDMERVNEIHREAQTNYTSKDDALSEYLERLSELHRMTQQYAEYLETANALYQQVREGMWKDAVAANDILTQLENYPDIVLAAFPDLYEIRQQVNERLSANTRYGELYRVLFVEDMAAARDGVEQTREAAEEFSTDNRFAMLRDALNLHLYFLNARQQFHSGQRDDAIEALHAVAVANGHPDQPKAKKLLESIP